MSNIFLLLNKRIANTFAQNETAFNVHGTVHRYSIPFKYYLTRCNVIQYSLLL